MDINFLTRVESHAGDLFSLGLQGQTLPSIKSHETLDRVARYEYPRTVPAADASVVRTRPPPRTWSRSQKTAPPLDGSRRALAGAHYHTYVS